MWPSTPAGGQCLAITALHMLHSTMKTVSAPASSSFRGSLPHPMQSLCTLRNHCRQWPRNTRYQADATPYLGRTCTGWIAPALPGALIRSLRRRGRARWAEFRGQAPNVTLTVVGDLRSSNGEAMSAIFRNHRDEGPIPGSREIKDRRKRLNAIFDATSDAG